MKVINNIKDFEKPDSAVVTIGTFDGVHLGHQEILNRVVADAKSIGGKSILITFWPHPRFILEKDATDLKLLSTFDEKVELLEFLGLDFLIKIPFTPKFSNLSAEEFTRLILVDSIGTKKLYIGYDHRFGNDREGDIHFLREKGIVFDYEVFEIPRQDIDDIGISSTKIRSALLRGEIQLANSLLGRSYTITGTVVEGQKVGRKIGFPTANLEVREPYKLLPGDGAYAVIARIDGNFFNGMLNIGFKPTVDGKQRTIEVHLFNFDENIYGRELIIEFVQSLRKEQKFDSLESLKNQLQQDKDKAKNILQ
ncbi:MAG: bifunctional riboflavin kinase/FAD synthetase [Cyclobacteriaceae bacterium]